MNRSLERLYRWKREEIIGIKPILLIRGSENRTTVVELKKQIALATHFWSGRVRNRLKNAQEIELGLAAFRISTMKKLPANLYLGIVTPPGSVQQAINELLGSLSRELFQRRNGHRRPKAAKSRYDQIVEMSNRGYTMKEIAEALGESMNTPLRHPASRDEGRENAFHSRQAPT